MHIHSIVLSGFKSYRDTVVINELSPGHNVIVGRNGAGKSNFFDAIRFVLSDAYSNLRNNDRNALLHEGTYKVPSAYVEITFDNSDGRLPFDKDQVTLRRIISQTKDEYVIDKKNVTRTEVFNLLETAGFSKSNPYYIVQQGKISAMCSMKDEQRLQLLEEVAGTRLYDERREESLAILEETATKRTRIMEVIQYLEDRLSELETEKEELKKLEELERERRALEYTHHVMDLEEIKGSIENLETERSQVAEENDRLYESVEYSSKRRETLEHRVEDIQQQIKITQAKLQTLREQHNTKSEQEARLKISLVTTENAFHSASSDANELQQLLNDALERDKHCRERLREQEQTLEQRHKEEMEVEQRIHEIEQRILRLHSRQQAKSRFSNAKERDAFLKKEIEELASTLADTEKSLSSLLKDQQKITDDFSVLETEEQSLRHQKKNLEEELAHDKIQRKHLVEQRNQLQLQRQELWRNENELEQDINSMEKEISKKERDLCYASGSKTYKAVEALFDILKGKPNLKKGFYGPLYELFTVEEKFFVAVEVAAGQSLSFIVVKNQEIASALVKELQRVKGGRLTFIPLEDIEIKGPQILPPMQDAFPILNKITPKYEELHSALQAIFHSTMIARSITVATTLSKEYNINCVTLDGDTVNKTGAMTGGYADQSRSRLKAFKQLSELRSNLQVKMNEKKNIKEQLSQNESQLAAISSSIQKLDIEFYSKSSELSSLEEKIERQREQKYKLQEQLQLLRESETTLIRTRKEIETSIHVREQEIGSPLVSSLSPNELSELENLNKEKEELEKRLVFLHDASTSLQQEVSNLEAEIQEYLHRKIASLRLEIQQLKYSQSDRDTADLWSGYSTSNNRSDREAEYNSLVSNLSAMKEEIEKWDEKITNLHRQETELKEELELLRQEESTSRHSLEVVNNRMEQLYMRRAKLLEKKASIERALVALGSLPGNFDEYRTLSRDVLEKRIQRNQNKLKRFTHVNRKALDQYRSFTEQREVLRNRLNELEKGDESIRQLIDTLDSRKDEDIRRTFRSIREQFSKIFEQLVPGGNAELVMKYHGEESLNTDTKQSEDEEEKENANPESGDQNSSRPLSFAGVSIQVSFPGSSEVYLLEQLSGGQRSIVALSLIFAIQLLDPAPFYLFDEIDANLDATYRKAVSHLIQNQSKKGTQFITTTFRPEFLLVADKWFGVSHLNKLSTIQEVPRDDALLFVGSDDSESRNSYEISTMETRGPLQ
eukprot:jgi/Galph1/689/GphlegSOOS_G5386.1